jgi:hypothetical protein
MDKDKDKAIDFFEEQLELEGVAVSSVADGTILAFKRSTLEDILKKHPDNKKIVIFVKQRDFKN